MNKKILFLALSSVLIFPFTALGQLQSFGPRITVFYLLDKFLASLWIIFAAFAVIMFVYSGIIFLTAQGDPSKISTARQAFLWGVVGVIVGIIAYSIITVVGSIFGL
ncbi:MAG: hypothetical protein A2358_02215 [Candidatus Staskawiczbacteria bacterium RIFOXYB1_FULL_37_44]|uniref:Uncharacterized protein n=1 Tax=Candidatus Staskawiczbacteria bacterium RIFOXYB1_FULL_37_44 TaxID=1802223 RepID=A0A1G2IU45_9BACT|nr:MAG: hypothetical protein A2358_02215 [Candidatus Staskawiczbacteria bacterium RIFOXYB1_FULL_37_44]OGZ82803.1 MAG: hypothetical protein A2416_03195 [Candidatus Staskawiczbacteria bacterium RIFOXYC1_FULL_37_52]OGZ89751.1 MAG: hypothetical protein A2444_01195 [Candidatus Staskawiczbacteria bacterium RIFOXYC2_FULL_37_19]OGZ90574.1 MAG: hypothetical protein A2581_02655 [Candidatus Staskawiczbacteria bacterium RIFOXYD1_FULL_37_110]